ncbi:MAG: YeeE/YedE family protein [Moraxellaceae bacterium]|nr:MAG: YeeE/YedE family protein [Moraxellaceae bacterium]
MDSFLAAFIGGTLLGVAVSGYLLIHGRIAGISGLIDQVFQAGTWRNPSGSPAIWFIAGLLITPWFYQWFAQPEIHIAASPSALVIAGLLVGFGTRLGSGCTSGHGICGISRLSPRSLVATFSFMLVGMLTVYCIRHVLRTS